MKTNITDKNKKVSKETVIITKAQQLNTEGSADKGKNQYKSDNIRDISSKELVREIKIGWNLGNTMDATGGTGIMSETSWGNPITTKEMIDAVKNSGFNTIRIPVTWEKHLGPAPDYTIDKEWLDRVQEIVDYGMDNGMFVIINLHHEEWHFPSYKNLSGAKTELAAVWKQIAKRFENYDEHLIYEGLNEPRMKGTEYEWNGGTEESGDVINRLNEKFIQIIRKSGGNNAKRHLMIPPYAASSNPKTWNQFNIPKDNKVIVSIHAYIPYNFALNSSGTSSWSPDNSNDTSEIDYLMTNIYNNFISKGVPVIIGEFGARDKNNLKDRTVWAEYYVKKASEKGISCIWWDNGAFSGSGENFGLFNRLNLKWEYIEIANALMQGLN